MKHPLHTRDGAKSRRLRSVVRRPDYSRWHDSNGWFDCLVCGHIVNILLGGRGRGIAELIAHEDKCRKPNKVFCGSATDLTGGSH